MASDRDIMATASLCIKQHSEGAGCYAASRADELEEQVAHAGALTWRKVLRAIEKMQRQRRPGETVN